MACHTNSQTAACKWWFAFIPGDGRFVYRLSTRAICAYQPVPTPPMDELENPQKIPPFDELIGMKMDAAQLGQARLLLNQKREVENLQGAVHGGVLMTLLDSVMARAAMSRSGGSESVLSVNLSVTFMKPAKGNLVAHGHAVGGGKSLCFCEGHVVDEGGNTVARGTGTFKCRSSPG